MALSRATEKVLAEKTAYVEKHRKRLLGEAASQAREVQARYHAAIDLMAEARDELRAARQAELWAALCPDQLAGQTAPDSLCGGRKQPLQKLGLTSGTVQANLVIEALHDDADWQRGTATHEQYAALHDKHPVAVRPGKAEWANDPAVKAARDKQTAEWLSKR